MKVQKHQKEKRKKKKENKKKKKKKKQSPSLALVSNTIKTQKKSTLSINPLSPL